MKTIIKLTNEYASNLKVLFFNFNTELASYYDMFDFIFQECILSDEQDIAKYEYSKTIDIIFIKIDNNIKIKEYEAAKIFIQSLRNKRELLPVYLIEDNITDPKTLEMIDKCYCIDGVLPTPFDRDKVYQFLYRILKRSSAVKELHNYVDYLESQLLTLPTKTADTIPKKETPPKQETPQVKKRDEKREQDIRFSQTQKISAVEFMNSLDDGIIDKVEDMEIELDALIGVIYRLEEVEAVDSVLIVKENIRPIIANVFTLVDTMGYFAVAARAFETLNTFLSTLSVEEFEDKSGKELFITMMLAVINDLEKWLQVIFIDHSTEDIHYLDASFSSNILEIEQAFLNSQDDDGDEDDLEFF